MIEMVDHLGFVERHVARLSAVEHPVRPVPLPAVGGKPVGAAEQAAVEEGGVGHVEGVLGHGVQAGDSVTLSPRARAMLEAAGYRVHAYTSPHLVRFHERIRLAGDLISDDYLVEVLDRCEQANAGAPITYFEVTTAAAFLAFAETPADVVLLETGLGGRLDATNVVEPEISVITSISLDHTEMLGDTIAQIARALEKRLVAEDLHNFGADYDRTLMCWWERFREAWPELRERLPGKYTDRFYRMWKFYLLSSAGGFRARHLQLWQWVLSPEGVPGSYRRPV